MNKVFKIARINIFILHFVVFCWLCSVCHDKFLLCHIKDISIGFNIINDVWFSVDSIKYSLGKLFHEYLLNGL